MNNELMFKLSDYLNNTPDAITEEMIKSLPDTFSLVEKVEILLSGILDIYDNHELRNLLKKSIYLLNKEDYINNPYYKNIKLDNIKEDNWFIKMNSYKPYELFVFNDLKEIDGVILPSLGFFKEEYEYITIYQDNREWMLITPNEINTMKKPIEKSTGNVVTYGLGLGYYAYMTHLKENVTSVTIIEKDKKVINIFNKYILPQFKYPEKIKIIEYDAIDYAKEKHKYDYCFIDIWHDPSDGVSLYKEFKKYEIENCIYSYWIEETLKFYI